jgi:hypothetical protein
MRKTSTPSINSRNHPSNRSRKVEKAYRQFAQRHIVEQILVYSRVTEVHRICNNTIVLFLN